MFDWIIEADIYRLRKEASEASDARQRRELEARADQKAAILARRHASIRAG